MVGSNHDGEAFEPRPIARDVRVEAWQIVARLRRELAQLRDRPNSLGPIIAELEQVLTELCRHLDVVDND